METAVLELLVTNGLQGTNSRHALRTLETQRNDPAFVAALSAVFAMPTPPAEGVPAIAQAYSWPVIRNVAGWVLKTVVHHMLQPEAMISAAGAALNVLQEDTNDRGITSAAAVIIARITALAGVEWWLQNNLDLSNMLLSEMLPSPIAGRCGAALKCLQYLVEDAATSLGESTRIIITSVSDVGTNHADARVRGEALGVLSSIYEVGVDLDWRVEVLSPLQLGLTGGSPSAALAVTHALANCTTLDAEVAAKAFRTATLLMEYLPYLEAANETSSQLHAIFSVWAQATATATATGAASPETATESCNLIAATFNGWEKTAGEGSVTVLCEALCAAPLETLIDNLLLLSEIREEEEQEILATDHYAERDRHVRRRSAKRKHDTQSADDDMCADATLRNAACLALEAASTAESERVAAQVMARAGEMLTSADWHKAEAAICALGTIYSGCQNQLIDYLPSLIPMIGAAIGDGQPDKGNHVATMSICIFTLTKFGDWALTQDTAMFDKIVACVMPCLTSMSKRVQWAAITFFDSMTEKALLLDPVSGGPLATHLGEFMAAVYLCLPVYHTNNLHLLCKVTTRLTSIMGAHEQIQATLLPFETELQTRLPQLQRTMSDRYICGNLTVSCDCDAFEVGAVVAAGYIAMAARGADVDALVLQSISVWVSVLNFAHQCDCADDDATFFHSPVSIISQLCNLAAAESFAPFCSANDYEFVQLILNTGSKVDDSGTRSCCCMVIYSLLECYGVDGIPSVDAVLHMLLQFRPALEDCGVVADAALVVCKILELTPLTDHLLRVALTQAAQVRGDTFDNKSMVLLAECVGSMMRQYPERFTLSHASHVALALRTSANTNEYKSLATQGVAAVITGHAQSGAAGAEEIDWCFTSFIKLACSWQKEASQHAHLPAAISAVFQGAAQHAVLSATMQRELDADHMPPTMLQLLRTTYRF